MTVFPPPASAVDGRGSAVLDVVRVRNNAHKARGVVVCANYGEAAGAQSCPSPYAGGSTHAGRFA